MKQHESIGKEEIENCAFEGLEDNEEGIPYVMGNTLWAFYQFSVLIVLLSVLRARMVNTYHRIFKEADVQWKFFRFVIILVHDIAFMNLLFHEFKNFTFLNSGWWTDFFHNFYLMFPICNKKGFWEFLDFKHDCNFCSALTILSRIIWVVLA